MKWTIFLSVVLLLVGVEIGYLISLYSDILPDHADMAQCQVDQLELIGKLTQSAEDTDKCISLLGSYASSEEACNRRLTRCLGVHQ